MKKGEGREGEKEWKTYGIVLQCTKNSEHEFVTCYFVCQCMQYVLAIFLSAIINSVKWKPYEAEKFLRLMRFDYNRFCV
jgi:hypothetical protein